MITEIKNRIAVEKGYPSWDEMYNWISRPGQKPEVIAQLIEAATLEYSKEVCIQLSEILNINSGTTMNAYNFGIRDLKNEILDNL